MTCRDFSDLVEAIAAGDEPAAEVRAHLESCPSCAAALATARRIEAALSRREAPAAPAQFTSMVQQRIRRERWQTEERVDRVFNLAIAAAVILVVGGLAALLNLGGLLSGAARFLTLATTVGGEVARDAAPVISTYLAAAGLLVSALGLWWWADRRLSL